MTTADVERAAQLASRVRWGIVTALPEEHAAVLAMLDDPVRYTVPGKGASRVYDLGEIPALGGGTHVVALALLVAMGNNIAAARGTLVLEHFKQVEAILMVGIAGGVPWPEKPDAHVRLGDIVVSGDRGVIQFDFVKKTRSYVEHRHSPRPPCARLLESVAYLASDAHAGKRPWEAQLRRADHIEGAARPSAETDVLVSTTRPGEILAHPPDPQRREGMPRVFQGAIASSGTLLKDARERDRLRREFNVRAVEMEASGIADATWNHGVGYLVIRGICDYCDGNKNDLWHGNAAVVAAAYARALLERTASQAPKPPARKKSGGKPEASPPHNLPPRRLFVGREAELDAIDAALARGSRATIGQGGQASVYGLGGIGKTALALEYAWKNLGSFPGGVYWIEAEGRPLDAMVTLSAVLRSTGPPAVRDAASAVPRGSPPHHLATAARSALQNQGKASLLILDNVSEVGFGDLVPASPVRVLVTTRDERLGLGETALVEVLSAAEAIELAEELAEQSEGGAEAEALERVVVKELGGLAVAVEMAALAVKGWAESWRTYERELRKRAKELMNEREPHSPYPRSVMAALDLSLDRCERGSDALRLLEGMAVFAPNGVPMEWAEAAAGLESDSVEVKRARHTLKGLGLIAVDQERKTLSMHRLVHGRVRERAVAEKPVAWWERHVPWMRTREDEQGRKQAWVEACGRGTKCVADCLKATVGEDRAQRTEVEALRHHIQEALLAAERWGRDREWIVIAGRLAEHLDHCALFVEARLLLEKVLEKAERLHPADPHLVTTNLNLLGHCLWNLGKAAEARPLFERALAIAEETDGAEAPQVGIYLTNLACQLHELGKAAEAQPLYERALGILERTHGPEHPELVACLSNLAAVLRGLGKAAEARPPAERALAIVEGTYGPEHPKVAFCLTGLSLVLRDLGKSSEAQPLLERALSIQETLYGPDHPESRLDRERLDAVLRDLAEKTPPGPDA